MYHGDLTTGALVRTRAAADPDRRVLRFEDEALTYGELDDDADRTAAAFAGLGIGAGDTVAVMLGNGADHLRVWTGLARAGIVEVPINTGLRGDLLTYQLRHSRSRALVVEAEYLPRLAPLVAELPDLAHVVVVGAGPDVGLGIPRHPYPELRAAAGRPPSVTVDAFDPAVILYTAGTTGPSKGAVLTHNANFRLARNVTELMDYGPSDVLYSAFPLFHVNARYTTVLPAMLVDGEAVLHRRFSASGFWDTCRSEQVTAFNYMGALLMMLHKQPERADDADNPVRRAYGAPAPISIYRQFEERFGMQLVEVYGSTELGTATMNTVEEFRPGSCGRAVPYFDVAVHDEYDEPCPPGVDGEIVVRPLEPHVMVESYHRMPAETLRAFRNLWFHTGDRGHVDADGYFYYTDRIKDSIRRRGENISSWEVEKVVDAHETVQESAAIGVASELTEEEVLVVVVPRPGRTVDPAGLLDHCTDRMPHFAVPRYVRVVDALPRNIAERVEKYKLRDDGVTADTWDRDEAGYLLRRD